MKSSVVLEGLLLFLSSDSDFSWKKKRKKAVMSDYNLEVWNLTIERSHSHYHRYFIERSEACIRV